MRERVTKITLTASENKLIGRHLQVRQAELYLPVQASRPHQGRIQSIWSVCGHQDFDVSSGVKAVQLVDELQHGPLDLVVATSAIIKTSTWLFIQKTGQFTRTSF